MNNNVSKSYVGKYIKSIENKLIHFENELNINDKNNKIRSIIKNIDDDTRNKIEDLL